MKKIVFETLNETLWHEKLDNGLDVYVLNKEGFHKTYATFTTKYGSIDRHFTPIGSNEAIEVPDGIAHFLEHKMFEKEDGDVFYTFSKQGAQANAFTSFTRTAYLFSSTSNVEENLMTLLNFVQEPYFTESSVEKEKGIIGQEIRMYDDNPDWRAYFGFIENLYHTHPVRIDIAGTEESISHITKDLLYTCYETFYHPSNMLLFVVGAVNPEQIMESIRKNQAQKTFKQPSSLHRYFEEEPKEVWKKERTLHMPVQVSKCYCGFKQTAPYHQGEELLKYESVVELLLDYLFASSSPYYEKLYEEGLIDRSFGYSYTEENGFGFVMIGGDTKNSDLLSNRIQAIIQSFLHEPIDETTLTRMKKNKIGKFMRALNSPEYIANQFTRYQFNEMNLFDVPKVLESITLDDLEKVRKEMFQFDYYSVFHVKPNTMSGEINE